MEDVATTSAINIVEKADVTIPLFAVNQPFALIPPLSFLLPMCSSNFEFSTDNSNSCAVDKTLHKEIEFDKYNVH